MKNIHFLKMRLDPEQNKALDLALYNRETTAVAYKLLRKKYAGLKGNIKRIEKKLLMIMQEAGEENFVCRWVQREVEHIENKYPGIDKAAKKYAEAQRAFNKELENIYFFKCSTSYQFTNGMQTLDSWLRTANSYISSAENDMRITKRYFKNITSAFASHATTMAYKKAMELRKAKLLQEQIAAEAANEHVHLTPDNEQLGEDTQNYQEPLNRL
jgi:hypothetical protein